MGNESAIILPVPHVEPIVSSLRQRYDQAAALGVPAHITLLYPFRPPPVGASEIEALAKLFGAIQPFTFLFTEVRRFTKTVYLHPDKPEKFVQIVNAMLEEWPDCKPYGGAFREVIPHLTVADQVDVETQDELANPLREHLPMECAAAEAWLVTSDHAGCWYRKASFAFGVCP